MTACHFGMPVSLAQGLATAFWWIQNNNNPVFNISQQNDKCGSENVYKMVVIISIYQVKQAH